MSDSSRKRSEDFLRISPQFKLGALVTLQHDAEEVAVRPEARQQGDLDIVLTFGGVIQGSALREGGLDDRDGGVVDGLRLCQHLAR